MIRSTSLLMVTIGCVGLLTGIAPGGAYQIIDLGTLAGSTDSYANAVGNSGIVVGYAWVPGTDSIVPVLFDTSGAGNNTILSATYKAYGSAWGYALGVNDSGQIVGMDAVPVGEGFALHALRFDPTGGGNNLDLMPGATSSGTAYSVNNAGRIVGESWDASALVKATLFDPTGSGANMHLGTLGGNRSSAYAVNSAGTIVGYALNASGKSRAALFDPTGGGVNVDLGALGGARSWAHDINEAGMIVGSADTGLWGSPHAAVFDPTGAGGNRDLGTLGGDESSASSVNNTGLIVGSAKSHPGSYIGSTPRATLFDPSGGGNNLDLNRVLPPGSGFFSLDGATGINDQGWIVGQGYVAGSHHHAYLLKPNPAPVPLDLTYHAVAHAYADTGISQTGHQEKDNAFLAAYAYLSWPEEVPNPDPENPEPVWQEHHASALSEVGAVALYGWVHAYSDISMRSDSYMWTSDMEAYTQTEGALHVGVSSGCPVGTWLVLQVQAGWEEYSGYGQDTEWWARIYRQGHLIATLDALTPALDLPVQAGEDLAFLMHNEAAVDNAYWENASSQLRLSFGAIPEPATLSLLALGAMAVIRRRPRQTPGRRVCA